MPRAIYNEGRVVGLSAYELYVKQFLSENPDKEPASEREWLASTLAIGSSLLLKIDTITQAVDKVSVRDIQLPTDSRLCAASTIIASFFNGSGAVASGEHFATKVTDYGPLISNDATASPSGKVDQTGTVPYKSDSTQDWTEAQKLKLEGYMAILDGIVIQPGTWSDNSNKPPQKEFVPDMSLPPRIRLQIRGPIKEEFFILLNGFTMRAVVKGESLLDTGAVNTPSPEDGDYLGPSSYPWASKIVFSMPSAAISYFMLNKYTRELPDGGDLKTVTGSSIIDMETVNPSTYYSSNFSTAAISLDVKDFSSWGDGSAVLTTYRKDAAYPPALFGTYVEAAGTTSIYPLDVVAPGTVKMFPNATEDELKKFETTYPGTHAIRRNDNGTINILNSINKIVPIANTYTSDTKINGINAYVTTTQTGSNITKSLSLVDASGTLLNVTGSASASIHPSGINAGKLRWSDLITALHDNKTIDMYGDVLRAFQARLTSDSSYSAFSLSSSFGASGSLTAGTTVRAGTSYIVLHGLRLYISSSEPTDTDIPVGSIGIGW